MAPPLARALKLLLCLQTQLHYPNADHHSPQRRRLFDSCCWLVGYLCTSWWALSLLLCSLQPSSKRPRNHSPGLHAAHPVVFVPGVFATDLELWEGKPCADGLFRQRLWGGPVFGGDILKSRPDCWMEHMSLDEKTGLDPDGVRVRPAQGLAAAGCFMGLIENLARMGYEGKNMYMASYDWRLSFHNTEVRDQSLSQLKSAIELMVKTSGGRKVVVVPYSTGALYFLHFLKWVVTPSPDGGGGGRNWCSTHIKAVMNVGPTFLGVPKAVNGIFSDEAKNVDYVVRMMSHGVLDQTVIGSEALKRILHVSRRWDLVHYMSPKGGDSILGGINWSIEKRFDCETNNKKLLRWSTPSNETGDGFRASWARRMVHCLRTLLFGKMTPWPSADIAFADTKKKFLVDSTYLQMKPSEQNIEALSYDIEENRRIAPNNKVYLSMASHDALRFSPLRISHRLHAHLSHGTADELDDPRYTHYKYWSNPLETKLPDAPDTEIYCLYGIDSNAMEMLDDNKFSASGGGGYASIPLLSAGYMCAKGWRGRTRFNPSGMPTYVREYIHKTSDKTAMEGNVYSDVLGNLEVVEDILRVAAGASLNRTGGDHTVSNILRLLDVGINFG